jgi:hypothetical protein
MENRKTGIGIMKNNKSAAFFYFFWFAPAKNRGSG